MQTTEVATIAESAKAELAAPAGSAPLSIIERTYGLTDAQYAVLLKTTCKDAPREMAAFFMIFCQRRRLDPFSKHVYLWKQRVDGEDKWQIVSGIDGLRVIAARNPMYRGQTRPTWTFQLDAEGNPARFTAEASKYGAIAGKRVPLECEVTAYRAIQTLAATGVEGQEHWLPFIGIVRFDEFVKRRDGKIHGNWESQPEHQLRIRAEAMALRMAFPEDVGSIYLQEELDDRADTQLNVTPATTPAETATRTIAVKEMLAKQVQTIAPTETPATVQDVAPAEVLSEASETHEQPADSLSESESVAAAGDAPAAVSATSAVGASPNPEKPSDVDAIQGSADRTSAEYIVDFAARRGLTNGGLRQLVYNVTGNAKLTKRTTPAVLEALKAMPELPR